MSKKIPEGLSKLNKEIAELIKFARTRVSMSQSELSRRLGVNQSQISRLENPNYNGHTISTLYKIADIFNLDLEVAFYEKEDDDE